MNRVDSLVSIIIPCYNAERWVAETLESCLAQTYRPLEIIVVDDGSTDDSLAIIERYAQQHADIIQYETGPNRGGCTARNRGFARSRGEYVMFLDADDLIAPETIAALVDALHEQDFAVSACPWYWLRLQQNEWITAVGHSAYGQPPDGDYLKGVLTGWDIPPCALLWHRSVIDALVGWDETLHARQDTDLMLRALLSGVRLARTGSGSAYYRKHSSNSVSEILNDATLRSRIRFMEKAEALMRERGILEQYALPLGQAYHRIAIQSFGVDAMLGQECVTHAERLAGKQSITGTWLHKLLCRMIGVQRKEQLARALASVGIANRMRKDFTRQRLS